MTEAARDNLRGPAEKAPQIAEILRAFVGGFNTNSLDDVMAFFADAESPSIIAISARLWPTITNSAARKR